MARLSAIACLVALTALLAPGTASAQGRQDLSDQDLIEPWLRAKAVVVSLGAAGDTPVTHDQRATLDPDLSALADRLSELQQELEKVAIRIVTVPEFSYTASETSADLSVQVLDIEKRFDALFGQLQIGERPDVRAMQSAIDALGQILSRQHRFEHDVIGAIGSGSKNEMQALAGQWWRVGESVEGVKLAVEGLRLHASAPDSNKTQ